LINAPLNGRPHITYGEDLDGKLARLQDLLDGLRLDYPRQWLALQLLEGDGYAERLMQENEVLKSSQELAAFLSELKPRAEQYQLEIVDYRYRFISEVTADTVCRPDEAVPTLTDKIDKIVTHKYFGLPIFALIMLGVFQLTFAIGEELLGGIVAGWIGVLGEFCDGRTIHNGCT